MTTSRYALDAIRERVGDLDKLDDRLALSIDETTALTGLSRSSVMRLIAEGRLRRIKAGHRVLIPRTSIDALLTEGDQ